MAHKSILDLMVEGNYNPKQGRPIPIELIYQSNSISYEEYKAEVDRQRRVNQAGMNAQAISAEEARADALRDRAIRAGVPRRYLDYAIDLTRIADLNEGRGVYICGSQGSYKTTTACNMLRGWLSDNPFGMARFVRSTELLGAFKETFGGRESEQDVMGQYAGVGLLVVDDLGKEVASNWAVSRLWELFDRRYGNVLPTIVTSQHAPGELIRHLGEGDSAAAFAIVSRFRETYALLDMGGSDHR